ncbi:hypothetical protein BSKO_05833 [Bryopsis sp. KO-2023]|nr:hypothetical protein BSKO_05833 [Bryopsis sp. KO-2023]
MGWIMSTLASIGTAALALFLFVICLPRCVMRRVGRWSRLEEETPSTNASANTSTTVMSKSEQPYTHPSYKSEEHIEVVVVDDNGLGTIPSQREVDPTRRDLISTGQPHQPQHEMPPNVFSEFDPFHVVVGRGLDQETLHEAGMAGRGSNNDSTGFASDHLQQSSEMLARVQSEQVRLNLDLKSVETLTESAKIGPKSPFMNPTTEGGVPFPAVPPPKLELSLHRTKSAPSAPLMDQVEPLDPELAIAGQVEAKKTHVICGAACDIGQRSSMEDAHAVALDLARQGTPSVINALVGVFDGHSGARTSEFMAEKFAGFVSEEGGCPASAMESAFGRCERELWARYDDGGATDASGTTALVAMVVEDRIHVGNVGDCRAVLCRDGRAEQITRDHKPANEKERVVAAGGYLDGEQYLNGEIGVSRALGDCHLEAEKIKKRDGTGPLIALPEMHTQEVTQGSEFLVIGSDGVWDVISNQRASDMVRKLLVEGATPEKAALELVDEAKLQGSRDNITVAVMALRPLPLPPRKAPPRKLRNSRLRLASRSMLDVKGALEQAESEPVRRPLDMDL